MDARTRSPTRTSRPTGPVYQELPKPFAGLAGESRSSTPTASGSASLAAGGANYAYRSATAASSLTGAADPGRQPAEAGRARRRCAPTCRARPRSRRTCAREPGAPPPAVTGRPRTPPASPGAARGRQKAPIAVAARQLEREGLDDKLKVVRRADSRRRHRRVRRGREEAAAMKRAIRKHPEDFVAILGADRRRRGVVACYILDQPAPALPVHRGRSRSTLKAEFSTAQAVIAGQGQTVRVSGVRDRRHRRRRARGRPGRSSTMEHRPEVQGPRPHERHRAAAPEDRPEGHVRRARARAAARPVAKAGFTIPVANTLPDVNPDEVLAALDADTRDYLKLLLNGAGAGLEGRGDDLREVLRRFEPTHRDLARVTRGRRAAQRTCAGCHVAQRAQRRAGAQGRRPRPARRLVGARVPRLRLRGRERRRARSRELPSALRQTTDTLRQVERFAERAAPARRS